MHKTRVQLAREHARVEASRELIQKMLEKRFGAMSLDIVDHLNSLDDRTSLDSVFEAAWNSETLQQFREAVGIPLL